MNRITMGYGIGACITLTGTTDQSTKKLIDWLYSKDTTQIFAIDKPEDKSKVYLRKEGLQFINVVPIKE